MEPTVPKAELLERESRWSRPAGIAALVGVALFIASVLVQQSANTTGDTDAEQLINVHDHAGSVLAGSVLQGLAFVFFAAPLVFLFMAASGRSSIMRRSFLTFAIAAPILLFASSVVTAIGLTDAGDQFSKQLPSLERQTEAQAKAAASEASGSSSAGTETTATGKSETGTAAGGKTDTGAAPTEASTTGTTTTIDEENTPKEDRAEQIVKDSSTVKIGRYIGLPGLLAFLTTMVYVPLWSMRTGLITRFWGTLGMALGVAQIVLGSIGQLGIVLWLTAIGMMLLGFWPRGKPPAWEAGVAIPWLKPGEPPPQPGAPVEGSGREVSERPLPESGAGGPAEPGERAAPEGQTPSEPELGPDGLTQGQRRKKRKRRQGG